MGDIYATPEADLSQEGLADRYGGNIDDAISGNFEVKMLETLGEAWRGLKGFKLKCHIALAIYFLVYFGAIMISIPVVIGLSAIGADQGTAAIVGSIVQLVAIIATMPMVFAVMIMGMRHALGKSVSAGSVFSHFGSIPGILLCYILQTIMIMIGLVLLVLPGIYLMFAYMYAMPLVVEKKMGAWQAMETSRKAVTKVWFRFFGLVWLISLINILGLILLGIPWIWTIPWSMLAISMVYIKIFGVEAHTLVD